MRILHVFRNPVGGLFRHVLDLARGQSALGHEIAIFCDSEGGGEFANKLLEGARRNCSLGVFRSKISRAPGIGDLKGAELVRQTALTVKADVIHGHGAKGGLYARIAGRRLGIPSTYTPHAGSLNFDWSTPAGFAYLSAEKVLRRLGSGVCFVCDFEKNNFDRKVGIKGKPYTVLLNGLWPEDFSPAVQNPDATDFLTLGELRPIKGLDVLLNAMSSIPGSTLTVVGDGPSRGDLEALAQRLDLSQRVRFVGSKPWREAVTLGRIMVLPSHNESFPYVVLEAGAAGLKLVATAVGGVPEIVPAENLCKPGDVKGLRDKLQIALTAKDGGDRAFTERVRNECDANHMCRELVKFYSALKA